MEWRLQLVSKNYELLLGEATVGVDNRNRVAIDTDLLSINATDKLLPPTSLFASLPSQPLPQEGGAGLYA